MTVDVSVVVDIFINLVAAFVSIINGIDLDMVPVTLKKKQFHIKYN